MTVKWEEIDVNPHQGKIEQYLELFDSNHDLIRLGGQDGKHPIDKDWSKHVDGGFPAAFKSRESIIRYFSDNPNHNAGILAGYGRIYIDIDRKPNQPDGWESWLDAQREYGEFPDTRTVCTPHNGYHLEYDSSGIDIPNRVRIPDFPSVEVKSNGSQTVAEGSVSPENGRGYAVEDSSVQVAKVNDALLKFINRGIKSESVEAERFTVPEKVEEGTRHDVILKFASSMRAKKVSKEATLAAALAENKGKFDPPCSDAEVKSIVADVFTRYGEGLSSEYESLRKSSAGEIAKRSDRINIELVDRLSSMGAFSLYTHDDKGFGRLFADVYEKSFRYNATSGSWLHYDGSVWVQDVGGMEVSKASKEFSDAMLVYAATLDDSPAREAYKKAVLKFGQLRYRRSLVDDAASEHYVTADDLDSRDNLFNCRNVTINLDTMTARPHDPDDLLTKIATADYRPGAVSKLWEQVVNDVMQGDMEKIKYMRRVFGYCLTASTSAETSFMFVGETTRNGKSTVVETVKHMMGGDRGYACTMQPDSLATKKHVDGRQASGDIARIENVRMIVAPEFRKGLTIDASLFKQLTGGDTVTARHLNESEREFRPKGKIITNTNHKPVIRDDTLFAGGRIQVLTFDRRFTDEEQDLTLKDRLKEPDNLSGVLSWCLDGLMDYKNHGLNPPKAVMDATADYREHSDVIGAFITDCLIKCDENMKAGDAVGPYQTWCDANGFGAYNKSNFFDELRAKGIFADTATVDGSTVRNAIRGYRLKGFLDD